IITLSNPDNAMLGPVAAHTYTILDSGPSLGFESLTSSGAEGVTGSLIVVLNSAATGAVTVRYAVTGGTAGKGADYTLAAGQLRFDPGETRKSISLPTANDTLSEAAETVQVTLSAPVNAVLRSATTHVYTIVDNDAPSAVSFVDRASTGSE